MSRTTVVFENDGEIEAKSIISFGVGVKEGDSPIGFFGTGIKYAIAVLLRLNHQITIVSGEKTFEFSLKRDFVRGKEFDFVQMAENGADPVVLGFTTELGKQWLCWMAYRELACNCKDEGGRAFIPQDRIDERKGKTSVIVTGEEFASVHSSRAEYLLEDSPMFIDGQMEVRSRPGFSFFYKGVRIRSMGQNCVYTYNYTGSMEPTEDRTLKNQGMADYFIRACIMRSKDKEFIRRCVTASDQTLEGGMDYHGWSISPSPEFLEVVGEAYNSRMTQVNDTAVKVWKENAKQKFNPKVIHITKVQLMSLNKALDFLAEMGFAIRDAYPIVFTDSLGEGVLDLADRDQQTILGMRNNVLKA